MSSISVANKYGATNTYQIGEMFQETVTPDTLKMQTKQNSVFGHAIERLEELDDSVSHADRMEMKRDPTIRFGSLLKKFAILGRGWEVVSGESTDEIASFVQDNFENAVRGSFREKLRHMLSFQDHGIAIVEPEWVNDSGRVHLRDLWTREDNLNEFRVEKDAVGRIERLEQMGNDLNIPIDKVIIISYLNSGDKIAGRSDLESAWDSWFRKKAIKEFWSAHLELRSKINTVAQYEGRDLNDPLAQQVWKMLKNMQLGGRMIVPDGIELDTISFGDTNENMFFKGIKYYDGQLLKSLLTPHLVGEASTEQSNTGSFALGQTHFSVFIFLLKYVKSKLETVVNEQIIKPLVDYNYDTDEYPVFRLRSFETNDAKSLAQVMKMLVDVGIVDPNEPWIRDFMGIPEADAQSATGASAISESMSEELHDLKDQITDNEKIIERLKEEYPGVDFESCLQQ